MDKHLEELFQTFEKDNFKLFKELKLWTLLSEFGSGKEKFTSMLLKKFEGSTLVTKTSFELLKSIMNTYGDKKLSYIKQLEKAPFMIFFIDYADPKVKNFFQSIVKARITNEVFTLILSEIDKDTFDLAYPYISKWGIVSSFSSENSIDKKKKEAISNMDITPVTEDNFLEGIDENS